MIPKNMTDEEKLEELKASIDRTLQAMWREVKVSPTEMWIQPQMYRRLLFLAKGMQRLVKRCPLVRRERMTRVPLMKPRR
jgi:hypothetical protein